MVETNANLNFNNLLQDTIKASQSFVEITGALGIAGFVFDIADETSIELVSEITDHYLEDGTVINDHIVVKPERVTLRGFVGEYKRIVDGKKSSIQKTTEKLVTVSSYLPPISSFYQNAQNALENFNNLSSGDLIDVSLDAYKTFRNINVPSDNQSEAFLFFESLWNSKQSFTIQTPYRYYTDMCIESLKAVQSGQTKDETSFDVTFKKKRTLATDASLSFSSGRLGGMLQNVIENGFARGETVVRNIGLWT